MVTEWHSRSAVNFAEVLPFKEEEEVVDLLRRYPDWFLELVVDPDWFLELTVKLLVRDLVESLMVRILLKCVK